MGSVSSRKARSNAARSITTRWGSSGRPAVAERNDKRAFSIHGREAKDGNPANRSATCTRHLKGACKGAAKTVQRRSASKQPCRCAAYRSDFCATTIPRVSEGRQACEGAGGVMNERYILPVKVEL